MGRFGVILAMGLVLAALLGLAVRWLVRQCDDDKASGEWSLSCALAVACIEVLGHYDHTRAALQEVRFVVEEVTGGRQFEGRLMGFNNLPETRFEDIKRVLRLARERVASRQTRADR